ncbi:hypothetical protein [Nonomuraea typhae]|uniref:Uncharacterized protein n=1 Tax=Nonomuraea typhae TaxID=2603600 RepID=A0ABW7YWN9_9ACTN
MAARSPQPSGVLGQEAGAVGDRGIVGRHRVPRFRLPYAMDDVGGSV